MSSSAAEHLATSSPTDGTKPTRNELEMTETNHDLPARSANNEVEARHDKDDAATMAASEELKHTTISDNVAVTAKKEEAVTGDGDRDMLEPVKAQTPEPDPSEERDEEMRERISSPKKKRGRDFEDDAPEVDSVEGNETGSDGGANGNRMTREEPEKKRPRDTSAEPTKTSEELLEEREAAVSGSEGAPSKTLPAEANAANEPKSPAVFGSTLSDKPQTSSSAFASSGFASLASTSSSPFGTLGASKPSVFGGNPSTTTSGFGALGGAKSPTTTSTVPSTSFGGATGDKPGSGFAFGSGATTSGFGGLNKGSVFGSTLGNGFAGGSGPKLSSFAAPIKEAVFESKPAKAFGAPDSDEDEGSDEENSEGGTDSEEDEGVKPSTEEKKKPKATKAVEDGESGEVTLLQVRAKLFALESKEVGWKERGMGSLKINVPKSCVSYDQNGLPLSGSFDISGLDDENDEDSTGPRVPRLIMRQENTHRVVLNTIIVRAMEFRDKPTTTAAQIIFTAFEGEKEPKPVQMLLRLSDNNAKLVKSEIASIQREL